MLCSQIVQAHNTSRFVQWYTSLREKIIGYTKHQAHDQTFPQNHTQINRHYLGVLSCYTPKRTQNK